MTPADGERRDSRRCFVGLCAPDDHDPVVELLHLPADPRGAVSSITSPIVIQGPGAGSWGFARSQVRTAFRASSSWHSSRADRHSAVAAGSSVSPSTASSSRRLQGRSIRARVAADYRAVHRDRRAEGAAEEGKRPAGVVLERQQGRLRRWRALLRPAATAASRRGDSRARSRNRWHSAQRYGCGQFLTGVEPAEELVDGRAPGGVGPALDDLHGLRRSRRRSVLSAPGRVARPGPRRRGRRGPAARRRRRSSSARWASSSRQRKARHAAARLAVRSMRVRVACVQGRLVGGQPVPDDGGEPEPPIRHRPRLAEVVDGVLVVEDLLGDAERVPFAAFQRR